MATTTTSSSTISEEVLSPPSPAAKKQKTCEEIDPRSIIETYKYDDDDPDVEPDDRNGQHEMTDREFDDYCRQINESDGFDVMSFPRSFALHKIVPCHNLARHADKLKALSELALKQYNENRNAKLRFVKVVKANRSGCYGIKYYITFDVEDLDAADDRTMEFQALVWEDEDTSETEVMISRLKNESVMEV